MADTAPALATGGNPENIRVGQFIAGYSLHQDPHQRQGCAGNRHEDNPGQTDIINDGFIRQEIITIDAPGNNFDYRIQFLMKFHIDAAVEQ